MSAVEGGTKHTDNVGKSKSKKSKTTNPEFKKHKSKQSELKKPKTAQLTSKKSELNKLKTAQLASKYSKRGKMEYAWIGVEQSAASTVEKLQTHSEYNGFHICCEIKLKDEYVPELDRVTEQSVTKRLQGFPEQHGLDESFFTSLYGKRFKKAISIANKLFIVRHNNPLLESYYIHYTLPGGTSQVLKYQRFDESAILPINILFNEYGYNITLPECSDNFDDYLAFCQEFMSDLKNSVLEEVGRAEDEIFRNIECSSKINYMISHPILRSFPQNQEQIMWIIYKLWSYYEPIFMMFYGLDDISSDKYLTMREHITEILRKKLKFNSKSKSQMAYFLNDIYTNSNFDFNIYVESMMGNGGINGSIVDAFEKSDLSCTYPLRLTDFIRNNVVQFELPFNMIDTVDTLKNAYTLLGKFLCGCLLTATTSLQYQCVDVAPLRDDPLKCYRHNFSGIMNIQSGYVNIAYNMFYHKKTDLHSDDEICMNHYVENFFMLVGIDDGVTLAINSKFPAKIIEYLEIQKRDRESALAAKDMDTEAIAEEEQSDSEVKAKGENEDGEKVNEYGDEEREEENEYGDEEREEENEYGDEEENKNEKELERYKEERKEKKKKKKEKKRRDKEVEEEDEEDERSQTGGRQLAIFHKLASKFLW
jgi:hypothetical protein